MRYGMPTMIETDTLECCARTARELGLQFVELNINFPQYQLPKLDADTLNRLAEHYGIGYTLHLDDEMSIADFNAYVAEGYQKTVLDAIELAKKVRIPVLNMHLSRGAKYTLPDRVVYFFEAYEEDYLDNIRRFRDACEAAIGDSCVLICAENTGGHCGKGHDQCPVPHRIHRWSRFLSQAPHTRRCSCCRLQACGGSSLPVPHSGSCCSDV